MYCFSVESLVCIVSILQVFVLRVTNAVGYVKSFLQPVAISYDWVARNIKPPGNHMHYMLARVTVTTACGECIYDKFIKPESQVIDYRTHFTGITKDILKAGEEISVVTLYIKDIISKHIIVGHCLHRLFKYLILEQPRWNKRDIALYKTFQSPTGEIESLKSIAHRILKIHIHDGINNTVERSNACMQLYLTYKTRWDKLVFDRELGLNSPIAIDCEMVAKAGPPGHNDMLARVSLVDVNETCIYDKYVLPTQKIVNYRTPISGIDESKLANAVELRVVQAEVKKLVKGRILVGHDLPKDIALLSLYHPPALKYDTSVFPLFRSCSWKRPKLKHVVEKMLGITIQSGAHCSFEDARACMKLYNLYKNEWDKTIVENEFKDVDERDFTHSNPGYESPVVAIVCFGRPGSTREERVHRVSIVDSHLVCVYDKFVSESDEGNGEPYNLVRHEVDFLLRGRVIVGFSLRQIFSLLSITTQLINRRDAVLFNKFNNSSKEITQTELFNQFLPEHTEINTTLNSVDEAKQLMRLYLKYKKEWDKYAEGEYSKQFEKTYNASLEKPFSISNLILEVSNTKILGRVSIVDINEQCIYDKYIRVTNLSSTETKLDNDTFIKLNHGHPYDNVKEEIQKIVRNGVLIGYCVRTTLRLLGINKQWWMLRDISLFNRFKGFSRVRLPLNEIFKLGLNLTSRCNYDTIKTAKALMQLYKKFKIEWDEEMKKKQLNNKFDRKVQKTHIWS